MGKRKGARHPRTVIKSGQLAGRAISVLPSSDLDKALVRVRLDSGQIIVLRRAAVRKPGKPPQVSKLPHARPEPGDDRRVVSGGLPTLGRGHR